MAWVNLGIAAGSMLMSYQAGQEGKAAANKEAQLQLEAGAQRKAAANLEANVLETNATQQIAVAQRNMFDAQRQTRLIQSRAQAVAAASGGGATSPTALTVMGAIAKEGAVNASRAMYSGEEAARGMRLQAFEDRAQGEFAQTGGLLQAEAAMSRGRSMEYQSYASIASTAGGMYAKYKSRTPTGAGSGTLDWSSGGAGDLNASYG